MNYSDAALGDARAAGEPGRIFPKSACTLLCMPNLGHTYNSSKRRNTPPRRPVENQMTKQTALKAAARYAKAHGGENAQSQNKSWATRIANRWVHPYTGNITPVALAYAPKA